MVNTDVGLSAPGLRTRQATSSRLCGLTVVILVLLAAQFVLGMAVNLFVTIPTHHPGAIPPNTSRAYFKA